MNNRLFGRGDMRYRRVIYCACLGILHCSVKFATGERLIPETKLIFSWKRRLRVETWRFPRKDFGSHHGIRSLNSYKGRPSTHHRLSHQAPPWVGRFSIDFTQFSHDGPHAILPFAKAVYYTVPVVHIYVKSNSTLVNHAFRSSFLTK